MMIDIKRLSLKDSVYNKQQPRGWFVVMVTDLVIFLTFCVLRLWQNVVAFVAPDSSSEAM